MLGVGEYKRKRNTGPQTEAQLGNQDTEVIGEYDEEPQGGNRSDVQAGEVRDEGCVRRLEAKEGGAQRTSRAAQSHQIIVKKLAGSTHEIQVVKSASQRGTLLNTEAAS